MTRRRSTVRCVTRAALQVRAAVVDMLQVNPARRGNNHFFARVAAACAARLVTDPASAANRRADRAEVRSKLVGRRGTRSAANTKLVMTGRPSSKAPLRKGLFSSSLGCERVRARRLSRDGGSGSRAVVRRGDALHRPCGDAVDAGDRRQCNEHLYSAALMSDTPVATNQAISAARSRTELRIC